MYSRKKYSRVRRSIFFSAYACNWNSYQFISNNRLLKYMVSDYLYYDNTIKGQINSNLVSVSGAPFKCLNSNYSVTVPYLYSPKGKNSSIIPYFLRVLKLDFFTYIKHYRLLGVDGSWRSYNRIFNFKFIWGIRRRLLVSSYCRLIKRRRRYRGYIRYMHRSRERNTKFWNYRRAISEVDVRKRIAFNKNNNFLLHYYNNKMRFSD